MTESLAE